MAGYCTACGGTGFKRELDSDGRRSRICPNCDGSGFRKPSREKRSQSNG